jgi:hypothetical protein
MLEVGATEINQPSNHCSSGDIDCDSEVGHSELLRYLHNNSEVKLKS